MRVLAGVLLVVFSFSLAAAAADLKVKVVDPQGAAVAGAQVALDCVGDVEVVHVVRNTAPDGMVTLIMQADWRGMSDSSFSARLCRRGGSDCHSRPRSR